MDINHKDYHSNLSFFRKFQVMAMRTFPKLESHIAHLIHMSFGLNTEMNELEDAFKKKDIINVSEELADMMWYFACYIFIRNEHDSEIGDSDYHRIAITLTNFISMSDSYNTSIFGRIFNFFTKKYTTKRHIKLLYYNISLLQDPIKKLFVYKQAYDKEVEIELLMRILISIRTIYYVQNLDFEKSLMNVIDKLIKRFPEKFTEYLAQNRNLEAERKELEK